MDDKDRGFFIEIYKETGAHMRATERKSLIVTGSYIGLFAIFLPIITQIYKADGIVQYSWLSVAIQAFFLLIGTCIYVMQKWYRAWKEHYLEVSLNIRKKFIDDNAMQNNYINMVPYWLRQEVPESRISIDNLLKYVTTLINFILVMMISYQILTLEQNKNLAILVVIIIIFAYIGLLLLMQHRIRKSRKLLA